MTSSEGPHIGDRIHDQGIYTNPSARCWTSHHNLDARIEAFHRSLPQYAPTPLVSLPLLAQRFSVAHVLLKDESYRLDLKAFKILGASWGTYRGLAERLGLPLTVSMEELGRVAKAADISLYAATEGNHGRAVARMAKWLNVHAHIFIPQNMDKSTQDRIASEGAQVEIVEGDYDLAVEYADQKSAASNGLLIQDNAWPGYEDIPTVRYIFLHSRRTQLTYLVSGSLKATRPCYRKLTGRSWKSPENPLILS